MRHEPRRAIAIAPLYDAMMHVARLMGDAAEAADWDTLAAARDCAKLLTSRIDEAHDGAPMPADLRARRYAALRDVLRQDARVREAITPTPAVLRTALRTGRA
jgi:hypothetical protein